MGGRGVPALGVGGDGVRSPDPIWIGEEGESEWGVGRVGGLGFGFVGGGDKEKWGEAGWACGRKGPACWAEAQWGGLLPSFFFFFFALFSVFFFFYIYILCFLLVSYYFSFSKLPKWHLNRILQIMPLPQ